MPSCYDSKCSASYSKKYSDLCTLCRSDLSRKCYSYYCVNGKKKDGYFCARCTRNSKRSPSSYSSQSRKRQEDCIDRLTSPEGIIGMGIIGSIFGLF